MTADKIASPYGTAALTYLPEWSPVPIATVEGEKVLLVKGVSGYKEYWADAEDAREWIRSDRPHKRSGLLLRDAGVALRLPANVIGIDLDCYGGKLGRETFAVLQGKWGALDPTWITTARPAPSGGRLYRVTDEMVPYTRQMRNPSGYLPDGRPYGGLDVLRWCHRYITVAPTWHGGVNAPYQWIDPDGNVADEIPLPEDLPYLPREWVTGLASGSEGYLKAGSTQIQGTPSDWLRSRPGGTGPLCAVMERDLKRYAAEIASGGRSGGCYPAANAGLLALVGNVAEGHRGGLKAVTDLWYAYRDAMFARAEGGRPGDAVEREFSNSLRGAIEGLPASKFRNKDICDWKLG